MRIQDSTGKTNKEAFIRNSEKHKPYNFNNNNINSKDHKMCQVLDTVWSEPSSPLIDHRSFFDSLDDPDQLFLLPDSVLTMDSFTFREDVNTIAPNFLSNSYSSTSSSSSSSKHSPHNSLDSSESNRSLRLLEDIEGLRLARASDGCRTLWLCDATSDGANVTPLPAAATVSSSPQVVHQTTLSNDDKQSNTQRSTNSLDQMPKKGCTQRNQTSESWFLFDDDDNDEGRSESHRDREDRVKRIREQQENERRRKLEELKQHALSAQKFRQQQEHERKRHIEELRLRDTDKRQQVEERKRVLEEAEKERRVAMLKKNKEREERIDNRRRNQGQYHYAFGSSTPRMIEPRVDSMSDLWGGARRSTSSSNVFAQMSQSMYCNRRSVERDTISSDSRKQRATSAHGLDRNDENYLRSFWNSGGVRNYNSSCVRSFSKSSAKARASSETRDVFTTVQSQPASPMQESSPIYWFIRDINIDDDNKNSAADACANDSIPIRPPRTRSRHDCHFITGSTVPMGEDLMSQSFSGVLATPTAHRRRTDLFPTLTSSSRSATPRSCKSPGLSRENTSHSSRPPSVMSTDSRTSVVSSGGVRMRNTPSRRPRPFSIATTGVMSSSMYEKKATLLSAKNCQKSTSSLTGGDIRKKRARSVTSDRDEDTKSMTSNSSSIMSKSVSSRRTPAQVKAESAARKAKQSSPKPGTPIKTPNKKGGSKSPSLSGSVKSLEGLCTPEEEQKSPKKPNTEEHTIMPQALQNIEGENENKKMESPTIQSKEGTPADESAAISSMGKRIITSEEEAKARLAEKRREMKEKKEREAEMERQRLAELERLEQERLKKEEEEERLAMEEAERMAEEARKAEEIRLQNAIEEAQRKKEEERKKLEEEKKLRKEKEEQEKKKQEELGEKLRKEEEERMMRKKRLEEIMSRTRKPNNNVPAADKVPETNNTSFANENKVSSTQEDETSSKDNIVNINHKHSNISDASSTTTDNVNNINNNINNHNNNDNFILEENAKNSSKILTSSEKGVIDTRISEGFQSDVDKNGDIPAHMSSDVVITSENTADDDDTRQDLDQIMELSVDSSKGITSKIPSPMATPLIAFEESITVPKQEPPTADLLS